MDYSPPQKREDYSSDEEYQRYVKYGEWYGGVPLTHTFGSEAPPGYERQGFPAGGGKQPAEVLGPRRPTGTEGWPLSGLYFDYTTRYFADCDESGHGGVMSCDFFMSNSIYEILVSGKFRYSEYMRENGEVVAVPQENEGNLRTFSEAEWKDPDVGWADAECTGPLSMQGKRNDPKWYPRKSLDPNRDPKEFDLMDLTIDFHTLEWEPLGDIQEGCSLNNTYRVFWSPKYPGPIRFNIYETGNYHQPDNRGHLLIKIRRYHPSAVEFPA